MRRLSLVTTSLILLAAGCGNNGNNGGGGDMAAPSGGADAACTAYATALCTLRSQCASFSFQTTYSGMAECVARTKLVCVPQATLAGTGQGPAALMSCAQALSSLSCPDFLGGSNFYPAACQGRGTLATGLGCGDDHQCQSGYCKAGSSGTCGSCAARGQAGAKCTAQGDCDTGLRCDGAPGARTCVAPAEENAACSDKVPCQEGLVCSSSKCTKMLAVNASCTLGTCDTNQGLQCDTKTMKCIAPMIAQAGGTCGLVSGVKVYCAGGSQCYTNNNASKCVPNAMDGAACNRSRLSSSGPGCAQEADCVSNVCRVPDVTACK